MKAAITSTSKLSRYALEIARLELGTIETIGCGHEGIRIKQYLNSICISSGNQWDAAFVFYIYKKASEKLKVENPLVAEQSPYKFYLELQEKSLNLTKPFPTKSSNKPIHIIDGSSIDITSKHLREGDIFLMQYSVGLWHIGLIEKVCSDSIITIEGCVNSGNIHNTIGVFEKRRKLDQVKRIIRIV